MTFSSWKMKTIKRLVARANVTIDFFTHLHIVIIRDDKIVMNITNSKKISVLLKIDVSFK